MLRAVERQGVEVQHVGEGGVHGHGARAVPRAGLGVEDLKEMLDILIYI